VKPPTRSACYTVTRVYLPHRLELLERTSLLEMRLNAVRLDTVTAGYLRYSSDMHMVTAEATHYHVNIPLAGSSNRAAETRSPSLPPRRKRPSSPLVAEQSLPTRA
jgi:hypothetical protein